METKKKIIHRIVLGCMAALVVMAAVGCAEEVASSFSDRSKVEIAPVLVPMEGVTTRAADGLNDNTNSAGFSCLYAASATTTTSPNSLAKVMIDDNESNYTPYSYQVTGATALTVVGEAPTFPVGVNSVNVYGWYPYTAANSFSIQTNQSTTTGYCLSDLMLADKVVCTRDASSVTPAPLAFRHVMSKVKIVLTPGTGVTVTAVALKNVKPTVAIDASTVTALTVGSASGDAGDVTLLSGGSLTSSSTAAERTLCGVFPAQTISSSFITVTAEIGGTPSTITYSFEAGSKTFASAKEYTVNISVSATQTGSPTVSLADWTGAEGTVNIGTGGGGSLSLDNTSSALTYGGSNGTINVTEASVSTCSASSADASIATVSTSGTVVTITPVAAGSTQVLVYATKDGNMLSSVVDVTVGKATPTITLSTAALSIGGVGNTGTFTVTRSGNGDIVAISSDDAIATTSVNQSTGVVTVTNVAVGSATITVTTNEGTNHLAYTASDKTVAVTTIADPGVALASATKGMIVASNGKAYTTSNYSSSYGGKVAVVAKSGYAIALVDASNDTWNSITNSGANKNVDCVLAEGKRGSVPAAPSGTTWKVLNMANYKAVFQAMGSADTFNATSNALITDAGGTALSGFYWSTQENYGANYGYYFYSYGWGDYVKPDSYGVRPVLVW